MDPQTMATLFQYLFGGMGQGGPPGAATPPLSGEAVPFGGLQGPGMLPPPQPSFPPGGPMMASAGMTPPPETGFAPSGTPLPTPRPSDLGSAMEPSPGYYGGSPTGPNANPNLIPIGSPGGQPGAPMDLAKVLGGIKAPPPPDIVKPGQAAAPQTRQIGSSELLGLLQSLMPGLSRGLRMPTTLGQALELKPPQWGGMYG